MDRRQLFRVLMPLLASACTAVSGCAYSGNGLWVVREGLKKKVKRGDDVQGQVIDTTNLAPPPLPPPSAPASSR